MINFINNIFNIIMNFNKINYLAILNYDVLQNISVYLKYYEMIELAKADLKNKELQNSIKVNYECQKDILDRFLINLKRYKVIKFFEKTFLPIGLIKKFPILEFQDNLVGNSDYLDSIIISHMNKPIMIGLDHFNRPYIIINYYFESKSYLLKVFQRYADNKFRWVKSDYGNIGPILKMSSRSLNNFYKKQFVKNLCQLLNKQLVSVIDDNFQITEIKCNL